jgi:hypothetical protein
LRHRRAQPRLELAYPSLEIFDAGGGASVGGASQAIVVSVFGAASHVDKSATPV